MDLNKSNMFGDFGNKMPAMDEQGQGNMLGKLFPEGNRKSSKEEYEKMLECAAMLEAYVGRFPREKGCVTLNATDMARWKNDFFKNLVHGGPELPDDQFYTGNKGIESNVGIGTDCSFTCEELFQFLYRLYKGIAAYKAQSADMKVVLQHTDLFGCASMLEKYVEKFPKTKNCVRMEAEDAANWKDRYFPNLVEGGPKLPDYAFFSSSNKNCGIGLDCSFYATELFQFLYRVYKEIVKQLR